MKTLHSYIIYLDPEEIWTYESLQLAQLAHFTDEIIRAQGGEWLSWTGLVSAVAESSSESSVPFWFLTPTNKPVCTGLVFKIPEDFGAAINHQIHSSTDVIQKLPPSNVPQEHLPPFLPWATCQTSFKTLFHLPHIDHQQWSYFCTNCLCTDTSLCSWSPAVRILCYNRIKLLEVKGVKLYFFRMAGLRGILSSFPILGFLHLWTSSEHLLTECEVQVQNLTHDRLLANTSSHKYFFLLSISPPPGLFLLCYQVLTQFCEKGKSKQT